MIFYVCWKASYFALSAFVKPKYSRKFLFWNFATSKKNYIYLERKLTISYLFYKLKQGGKQRHKFYPNIIQCENKKS